MIHPIYRVMSFAIVAPYTLRVTFDDTTTQVIDFAPILAGELYGPLRDASLFNQIQTLLRFKGHAVLFGARNGPVDLPRGLELDSKPDLPQGVVLLQRNGL